MHHAAQRQPARAGRPRSKPTCPRNPAPCPTCRALTTARGRHRHAHAQLPEEMTMDLTVRGTSMAPSMIDWDELIEDDRVHGSLYTNPAVWAAELQHIWYRTWVFVGHTSEIPAPNDYVL